MLKLMVFVIIFQFLLILQTGGFYDEIILDQYTNNELNSEFAEKVSGRISRYNRTTYIMNSNFTLLQPVNSTTKIRAFLHARQGNEFRNIFTISRDNACQFLKEDTIAYPVVVKSSNLPPGGTCPIETGEYRIKDLTVDFKPPPMVSTNEYWKMDVVLLNRKNIVLSNQSITFSIVKRF